MSRFFYKAKKDGESISGVLDSKDEKEAAKLLRDQNLLIISISGEKEKFAKNLLSFFTKRITLSDVVYFTRQLSSMITAGLTLTEALSILKSQIKKQEMFRVTDKILRDIEGGASFSQSLALHPRAFNAVYVAMVKAAEESGLLDKILSRLADNLESTLELRRKVIGALVYPAIIMISMLAVAFILTFFVIPGIKSLYIELNVSLPLQTRVVIGISDFVVRGWFLVIGIVGLSVVAFSRYRTTAIGRRQIDSLLLRLPVLGKLRRGLILTETTRTLGLLFGAGTPIVLAIKITSDTTNSIWYHEALKVVANKVEKGVTLTDALSGDPLFPLIVVQMAKVGETTGKLDETLLKVSSYYESEVDQTVKALTTILEPLIIVVLGVLVGFLIFAVITPIYNLTTAF